MFPTPFVFKVMEFYNSNTYLTFLIKIVCCACVHRPAANILNKHF